jgi:hypothetical protein
MIRVRRGAAPIGRVEPKGQWAIPAAGSFVYIFPDLVDFPGVNRGEKYLIMWKLEICNHDNIQHSVCGVDLSFYSQN